MAKPSMVVLVPARRSRRVLRWLGWAAVCVVAALVVLAAWGRGQLARSLPQVDGDLALRGLSAAVTVERDADGVPLVTGATRADVARALGLLHAQDRFFQMDLLRRRAAGELAELVGAAALRLDRQTRALGLRLRAREAVAAGTPAERELLDAYTTGVNAGLQGLGAPPFEYLLLGTTPVPWQPEDSALAIGAMYLQLQDTTAARETRLGLMYEVLPPALADFLGSTASEWETPLTGEARPVPPIPGADVFDLRRVPRAALSSPGPTAPDASRRADDLSALVAAAFEAPGDAAAGPGIWGRDTLAGSNNWAVAGSHTASGAAILANDMHLGLAVPNTWYRASLRWGPRLESRLDGLTLPGTYSLVVGTNGHVAWGFTNTTADWNDVVLLDVSGTDPTTYRTPDGWRPFAARREELRVKGGPSETIEVRETIWGPVIGPDVRGRQRALAWVALRPGGLNFRAVEMEGARSVEAALAIGPGVGIPAQNLVVADRDGHIGWTVAGRIPRRVGLDGRTPTSWADGTRGWDGWISPDEYPRLFAPDAGRIVTANNRLVDGEDLAHVGDGGYDPGARARQIRDALGRLEHVTPRDMLAVQLDDRALFLARWRTLLLQTLAGAEVTPDRADLRRVVDTTWTGHAAVDFAAYRLVREFRQRVAELALAPLLGEVRKVDPTLPVTGGRMGEGQIWALVTTRPLHLLAPEFASWDALLLAAADRVVVDARAASGSLAAHTWGRVNTAAIQHPLSRAVPALGWWLDLPHDELPGDSHMPRVQGPDFGASERLAISPGHEAESYLHMPGGQSGHPLSPYFRTGHRAWVVGEPTPLLPGRPVHTLRLVP